MHKSGVQAARECTLQVCFFDFLLRPPVAIHVRPVCIGVCVRTIHVDSQ